MAAYWKFLQAGAISPFSGHAWATGQWADADDASPCRAGIHACRAGDLPYWINDELWQFELAEPVRPAARKVVAARARAVGRVAEWDDTAAADLATACAARTAGHAADELAGSGLGEAARRLAEVISASPPAAWAGAAGDGLEAASSRGARQAVTLCGYVQDAVEALEVYPVATSAYIAARAASERSRAAAEDPYLAERAWQAAWLVSRLGLDSSAPPA